MNEEPSGVEAAKRAIRKLPYPAYTIHQKDRDLWRCGVNLTKRSSKP
jgi:hypothetical protein